MCSAYMLQNAFPVSGLFTTHLLSLDALLAVIDSIEQHCHHRVLHSTKSSNNGDENAPASDMDPPPRPPAESRSHYVSHWAGAIYPGVGSSMQISDFSLCQGGIWVSTEVSNPCIADGYGQVLGKFHEVPFRGLEVWQCFVMTRDAVAAHDSVNDQRCSGCMWQCQWPAMQWVHVTMSMTSDAVGACDNVNDRFLYLS